MGGCRPALRTILSGASFPLSPPARGPSLALPSLVVVTHHPDCLPPEPGQASCEPTLVGNSSSSPPRLHGPAVFGAELGHAAVSGCHPDPAWPVLPRSAPFCPVVGVHGMATRSENLLIRQRPLFVGVLVQHPGRLSSVGPMDSISLAQSQNPMAMLCQLAHAGKVASPRAPCLRGLVGASLEAEVPFRIAWLQSCVGHACCVDLRPAPPRPRHPYRFLIDFAW